MNAIKAHFTNTYNRIFWLILSAALLLRVVGICAVPTGVNQDEAMLAMDAWALSKYGTDRYGTYMPVHFEAWKYGQMSVLLAYLMVPFIKVLGFQTLAVRLPMALVSTLCVGIVYLIGKRLFSEKQALVIMALTAVNPWHFMQSRWALDCNLFPHIFLIGLYLLLLGLEKRRYLYLSMVFFGLTFYCYGVAVYTVPVFLVLYAVWCLWRKQLKIRHVLVSILIFLAVALPEILTMAINMFGWSTIETPLFTMQYFPESIRSNDILLLNFSWEQLWKNAQSLVNQVFLQKPDWLHNAIPEYGPLYKMSLPFVVIGMVAFTVRVFRYSGRIEAARTEKQADFALWCALLTGIWTGLVTREVNINRVNIIFYPLIILCGYGIWTVVGWFEKYRQVVAGMVLGAYCVCVTGFFVSYFTEFPQDIQWYFNRDFLEITEEADGLEDYDTLYITGHMNWQYNCQMAEILTQYSCKIDSHYYQELTNTTGGRALLPYSQRYHFVDMAYQNFADGDALYILHRSEVAYLPEGYEVVAENGAYVVVRLY